MSTDDSTGIVGSISNRLANYSLSQLPGTIFFGLVALTVYTLLLMPIIIVILSSFTSLNYPAIPGGLSEVSFQWYGEMLNNDDITSGMVVSLVVAIFGAGLGTLVAFITALGFVRSDFLGKQVFGTMMLLPMLITPVITGVAFIRFANTLNLPRGYPVLILAHSVLTFPFIFLLLRSQLASFNEDLESASMILGANPIETKLNVTLPILAPTIVGAYLLGFVVSFGEFTATQFLIEPGATTIPIVIFTLISTGLTPDLTALATVLVFGMIIVSALGRIVQEIR